jgi:hypothetical protein
MKNTKKSQSTSEKEFNPFRLDGGVEAGNDREEDKVDPPRMFNAFQDGGSSDAFLNDSTWTDPWSTDPWENDPQNTSFFSALEQPPPLVDSSFESSSTQYFTPSMLGDDDNPVLNASFSSPDPFDKGAFGASDPFPTKSDVPIKLSPPTEKLRKIPVMLQERLSILFDDVTSTPICRVTGFIYVSALFRNKTADTTIKKTPSHIHPTRWNCVGETIQKKAQVILFNSTRQKRSGRTLGRTIQRL